MSQSRLTHKNESRRSILRGLGVAMGLPALDAMQPASTATSCRCSRQTSSAFGLDLLSQRYQSSGMGAIRKKARRLGHQALARSHVALSSRHSMLSGLAQVNARSWVMVSGDHARSAAAFLTGAHPLKTAGANMRVRQERGPICGGTIRPRLHACPQSNWGPSAVVLPVHATAVMRVRFEQHLVADSIQPMA